MNQRFLSSHTKQESTTTVHNQPHQSNVSSNPSMLICCELTDAQLLQLSKRFNLTQFSNNLNRVAFDASLIDCRGSAIRYPDELADISTGMLFTLVDEESFVMEPSDIVEATGHIDQLELITENELASNLISLRMKTRKPGWVSNDREKSIESATKKTYSNLESVSFDILQLLLQNSSDWIVIKDLDHRFLAASNLFLAAQNLVIEDVIGKNDLEIGTDEEIVLGNKSKGWKGFWQLDKEVINSGKPAIYQTVVISENSLEQVREHVAKIPLKNAEGTVYGLLVFVTQSHIPKNNGVALTKNTIRRNLTHSPMLLAFNDERIKAEAKAELTQHEFQRKNNFIATASHDLRQPLHAIGLFIESLEYEIEDADQRATLSKMKQSSKDLNALLNSILDISKLDANAVPVSKTHFLITPLLRSIKDEFGTEASNKNLELNIAQSDAVLYTDSVLLIRILKNLLSNAIKYTNSGKVDLQTNIVCNSLAIHIQDTGAGIPKEQYQAIFNEYHRVAELSSEPNFGMGLGLSIVQRLTELLELDISLESIMGKGTKFTLTVPLGDVSKHNGNKIIENKEHGLQPFKILIVENDAMVLEAMQKMLTTMNCDAYPAKSQEEALEIIEELSELPDLLLVDYQLDDNVTGDSVIKTLCNTANKHIPSIIVTGNTTTSLFRKASATSSRVLVKPINPDVLLSNISSSILENQQNKKT